MMKPGRFANLEFDDDDRARPGQGKASPGQAQEASTEQRPAHFVAEVRDAEFYRRRAIDAELAGDRETALREYSASLGEDPLFLEGWLGQLWMLLESDEYPEAKLWADKALESFPDNARILALKSLALYRMGHRREARELNDAALQQKGESSWNWLARGELMLADDRRAAGECFEHALRVAERREIMLLRTGEIYERHGRFGPAMSALQEATASLPDAAWCWYLLGTAQENLGLWEQAKVSYRQAADLRPEQGMYRQAVQKRPPGIGAAFAGLIRRLFGR